MHINFSPLEDKRAGHWGKHRAEVVYGLDFDRELKSCYVEMRPGHRILGSRTMRKSIVESENGLFIVNRIFHFHGMLEFHDE